MNKLSFCVLWCSFFWANLFGQVTDQIAFAGMLQEKFELNYLLSVPDSIQSKKPLIVFLHGSGEKGNKLDDLDKLKSYGPLKYLSDHTLDSYILAPQCQEQSYWNSDELYVLIQSVIRQHNIDTNRIYLTGFSMGAWGTWNLAYKYPNLFAAIVPVAGYVDRVPMIEKCKLAHLPIKIFHGLQDSVVDVYYSIKIYSHLKECNKNIELNILPNVNHDTYRYVYETQTIYDWMLSQRK